MILLREEGRPAASHTVAGIMVERPDGAERVRHRPPCWRRERSQEGPVFIHTAFKIMISIFFFRDHNDTDITVIFRTSL